MSVSLHSPDLHTCAAPRAKGPRTGLHWVKRLDLCAPGISLYCGLLIIIYEPPCTASNLHVSASNLHVRQLMIHETALKLF